MKKARLRRKGRKNYENVAASEEHNKSQMSISLTVAETYRSINRYVIAKYLVAGWLVHGELSNRAKHK